MRFRTTLGAMLLVMTVAAGCGPTDGTAPDSTGGTKAAKSTTVKVGVAQQVKGQFGGKAEATVLKVTTAKKGKGDIAEAPANGQYAVVDVQIKVTGGKFTVNPLYVQYQGADGKTYQSGEGNAGTAGFEPGLPANELPAGQSTRGLVVFDVPEGKGKQVQLTDEMGSLIAAWQI